MPFGRLPLKYLEHMILCGQFGYPQEAGTLMPMGTGGEDGDSAVIRRARLHIAGSIGMLGCGTGSCRAWTKATSCNALLCPSVLGVSALHGNGRTNGAALRWHTFQVSHVPVSSGFPPHEVTEQRHLRRDRVRTANRWAWYVLRSVRAAFARTYATN